MSRTLIVVMNGRRLGQIEQDDSGVASLEYETSWISHPDAVPFSLALPMDRKRHRGDVVWNVLCGLLPDNTDVLARWARQFQVSANNPVALLGHVGLDVAGAMQFVRPAELALREREPQIDWLTDAEIARQVRDLRADPTAWAFDQHDGNFSLAGAQGKFALVNEDGRWGVPSGSAASTHIFKPGIAGFDLSDLNEHLTMEVARSAGLHAAESRMLTFEDQTAFVVQRFDRRSVNGVIERLHQEDMCQAFGVHPGSKYQNVGGPSPKQIVTLMRREMTARASIQSVEGFLDALIYNWYVAGTDAHAKNYSMTFRQGQAWLSPLYDVASVLPYPRQAPKQKRRLAMKIGSTYNPHDVRTRHWAALADEFGLEGKSVINKVRELGEHLTSAIEVVTQRPDVHRLAPAFVDNWKEVVTSNVTASLNALDDPGSAPA